MINIAVIDIPTNFLSNLTNPPILIFARYQKFNEVLWREAIVESAATNNSYMVVFDNSNPTIVPRN